jgi:hypothetical protein
MAPLQTDPGRINFLRGRLDELKAQAPREMTPVFERMKHTLIAIAQTGAPTQPLVTIVAGPGGTWKVGRFAKHDRPWIGLEWPVDVNPDVVDWIVTHLYGNSLGTVRADTPRNQLWFACDAS